MSTTDFANKVAILRNATTGHTLTKSKFLSEAIAVKQAGDLKYAYQLLNRAARAAFGYNTFPTNW